LTLSPTFDKVKSYTEKSIGKMRTKTLLLTAVLTATGIGLSSAQIFSVNSVGYVNMTLEAGLSSVSNPLNNQAGNTLNDLFPQMPPDGTVAFAWNGGGWDPFNYLDGLGFLANPDVNGGELPDIPPGGAVFISITAEQAVTFVGEVTQGDISQALPAGLSHIGSAVPQEITMNATNTDPAAGDYADGVQFPGADGDILYTWNGAGWDPWNFLGTFGYIGGDDGITPASIGVAQAFFISKPEAASWDRTFFVNDGE